MKKPVRSVPAKNGVPAKRSLGKTIRNIVLGAFASVVLVGFLLTATYVFWLTRDLPSYDTLAHYEPPVTSRVYAGNGTLIGEYARERRLFVPVGQMPAQLREAFLSAEDKNFYSHPGVDVFGILRAGLNDIRNSDKRPQGASTITQQVARNFLLSNELRFSRKIREMVLAMRIDNAFSKDQILELYLNEIFLGENSYGVAAAATNYFGKSLDELTLSQTAFLAALPKGPANYSPTRHKEAAIARRNYVLEQMYENGYINRDQMKTAEAEDLVTYDRPFGAVVADVDYFVEEVRRTLYEKYGQKALYDGGLQVRTTLDPKLQDIAVRSLRAGLIAYDRRHGFRAPIKHVDLKGDWPAALKATPNKSGVPSWRVAALTAIKDDAHVTLQDGGAGIVPAAELPWTRGRLKAGDIVYVEAMSGEGVAPGTYTIREVPQVNGAIVAMDPFTGHVLALSGGFSYGSSQFDRAMQALRQPGSTFKPFVYATALDQGYTPVTKVLDAPFAAPQGPGLPLWTPENYEAGDYLGPTTLRRGVELSRNLMTARLAHTIGMQPIADTVQRMGVYNKLPLYLANSLGAEVTTLLRLTTGYAEFVNGGRKLEATLIDRVQDRHGKTIYRFDKRTCADCAQTDWKNQEEPLLDENREQVLDPRTAYQIVSILEGVVQRGTGVAIKAVGKPLAGKTGTSSDFRDAWFVGFSPDLALGVFVGKDNFQTLGNGEQGALAAAPIFRDFMKEALADQPGTPFRTPQGIVQVPINPVSGAEVVEGTPGSILEAFKAGTEPGANYAVSDIEDPGVAVPTVASAPAGEGQGAATPAAASGQPPPVTTIGTGTGGLY
ncbi:MAG TPA: penicillin-binding protein 1A [Micropepsaceae bacterium]|jgi:penicillin-binding protein 1A|nr:penicillin-binding protein 1A [Micropepsaceae bacterium]